MFEDVAAKLMPGLEKKGGHTAYPSIAALTQIMNVLRALLFPQHFSEYRANSRDANSALLKVYLDLSEQVFCALRSEWSTTIKSDKEKELSGISKNIAEKVIRSLPEVRDQLLSDVEAAYLGDPAAKSRDEVILCYPSIRVLIYYRIAHLLHVFGVPLIPRMLTEMAHNDTGVDIHPGAKIGRFFFMDHGTGIVIGETAEIGDWVRIYQGVTLGAKSFPADEKGVLVKGLPRHPIVEDNVIIYAGATILGRIRIGKGSVIGANVWVTEDVPPGSRVLRSRHLSLGREDYGA